ncbi:MAG: tetratricopeptide repeat protein [Polyangiaceae bacterium]|nr:tetratricopeptide repeat protein [Polyangiaceae bacterium]
MRARLSILAFIAVPLIACAPAAAKPAAAPPPAPGAKKVAPAVADRAKAGREALDASKYGEAEAHFRAALGGAKRGEAALGLAETLLVTGRYDEAVKTARTAAASKATKLEAAWVEGEALRRQGKLAESEAALRKVEKEPEARRARLLLGEVLLERGAEQDAEPVLMTLVSDYNDDKITKTDGRGLSWVGRAAHLLRAPRDANDAFNESERVLKSDVPTLLWRAELFLEKYDPGHAEEVTKEVLAKAPNHPDALVTLAFVKLEQAFDFDEAERLARKALAINPKLGRPYVVLAGIALRDMELSDAEKHVAEGLKHNPRDLELLSMRAAAHFLADDTAGFEAAKKAVLDLNPRYTKMFQIIGDFADWEHRYDEIVAMMREAVRIDKRDAKAHAQLGLNLIRSGNDDDGVKSLKTAFDKDPFNVRVYNTLNLYDRDIPQNYVTVKHKLFTFRYHKDEKPILERYVPGLMETAWKKMVKDYGFTPSTPVGIELYAERPNFAIRTSGLPSTAIQGVCFGKTLASMSTMHEKFNLGMTLWHELAHVFHIQLSKSHVPRWFTEGLAEHETLVERAEWAREHDPDLYQALRSDRLPKVGAMTKAFTRAEEMSDVATAYYASSQIMVMLVKKHGMAKMAEMLRLWGQGKTTPDAVQKALGQSADALDQEFRGWAEQRLSRFKQQFVPISRTGPYDKAKAEAEKAPNDALKQTVYALAALKSGKKDEATSALEAALKADPKFPDAIWIKARVALGKKQVPEAEALLTSLVTGGSDGYSVQMALADIAEAKGDTPKMAAALERAHQHDPTAAEPISALVDLAKKQGRADKELEGLRKLALIEEHDGRVHRRLMRALLDKKLYKEAKDAGERALWVEISGLETHALFAEVLVANKMIPRAVYELESAVLCPARPEKKADAHAQLAETYLLVPNRPAAQKNAALARKLDPNNPRLKKLKI